MKAATAKFTMRLQTVSHVVLDANGKGQKLLPDAAQAWSSSAIAGTYKMSEKSMLELERCGYRSLATGFTGFAKG